MWQSIRKQKQLQSCRKNCRAVSWLGGLEDVAGIPRGEGGFLVEVPMVILDDTSFLNFCSQNGIAPSLDGAVVLNQIWDSTNSNFRYKKYVPFVKDKGTAVMALSGVSGPDGRQGKNGQSSQTVEIPVLFYTEKVPRLREEYQNYALVHFIPLTMWKSISGKLEGGEPDSYIRIFSSEKTRLSHLDSLERRLVQLIGNEYAVESENRVRERISNERMIDGMEIILGGFCVLLAVIGAANVFSNTLGFLRQRKREFAQYMSIGLTPKGMWKILGIEALAAAGKPILITLPCTVVFVQYAVRASCLDPRVFWEEAPILPILIFAAAIVLLVALAYYIGGRRLLRCDLGEVLRDDALV